MKSLHDSTAKDVPSVLGSTYIVFRFLNYFHSNFSSIKNLLETKLLTKTNIALDVDFGTTTVDRTTPDQKDT